MGLEFFAKRRFRTEAKCWNEQLDKAGYFGDNKAADGQLDGCSRQDRTDKDFASGFNAQVQIKFRSGWREVENDILIDIR